MNDPRQTDKAICCGGVVLMAAIAVGGYWLGNRDIALFGVTGFTTFAGPLFMAMNRELNPPQGGEPDPTQEK
jgi:hypothetical protein